MTKVLLFWNLGTTLWLPWNQLIYSFLLKEPWNIKIILLACCPGWPEGVCCNPASCKCTLTWLLLTWFQVKCGQDLISYKSVNVWAIAGLKFSIWLRLLQHSNPRKLPYSEFPLAMELRESHELQEMKQSLWFSWLDHSSAIPVCCLLPQTYSCFGEATEERLQPQWAVLQQILHCLTLNVSISS